MRFLTWVIRPWVLIGISILLVGLAALVALLPESDGDRPQALPLAANEQEIAFLYPATSATAWDRFVNAVDYATERLQASSPGLSVQRPPRLRDKRLAASVVPEVALQWPDGSRVLFRWYKVTSNWQPNHWAEVLLRPDRLAGRAPPTAIICGNTSESARKVALAMQEVAESVASEGLALTERPLLLFTTATADQVSRPEKPGEPPFDPMTVICRRNDPRMVRLDEIYPDRTFRFGFTNRQMASSATRFLWSRADLRPQSEPTVLVSWADDAYSVDLMCGYKRVLARRGITDVVRLWGAISGNIATGMPPAASLCLGPVALCEPPMELRIDSSVGPFSSPNGFEAVEIDRLLDRIRDPEMDRGATGRMLLVLTGQAQPVRRFLRDLARSAPETTRRFVVTAGDAISFNTIYRDREVAWPIQDLPFPLVVFCHRNPISAKANFHPVPARSSRDEQGGIRLASGTEDLLLFSDIVESLALTLPRDPSIHSRSDHLADGLRRLRLHQGNLTFGKEGVSLFGTGGQRNPGTGEHVVLLRPKMVGDRVLPGAVIEVWQLAEDRSWKRQGDDLHVSYDDPTGTRERGNHDK